MLRDILSKNTDTIKSHAHELLRLATAFSLTGNTHMCEELTFMANELLESSDEIMDGYSTDLSTQVNTAQASIGKILGDCLAHVSNPKKEKE